MKHDSNEKKFGNGEANKDQNLGDVVGEEKIEGRKREVPKRKSGEKVRRSES